MCRNASQIHTPALAAQQVDARAPCIWHLSQTLLLRKQESSQNVLLDLKNRSLRGHTYALLRTCRSPEMCSLEISSWLTRSMKLFRNAPGLQEEYTPMSFQHSQRDLSSTKLLIREEACRWQRQYPCGCRDLLAAQDLPHSCEELPLLLDCAWPPQSICFFCLRLTTKLSEYSAFTKTRFWSGFILEPQASLHLWGTERVCSCASYPVVELPSPRETAIPLMRATHPFLLTVGWPSDIGISLEDPSGLQKAQIGHHC